MIRINIITNNIAPNSRAFNYPLLLFKMELLENKYDIKFYYNDSIALDKGKLYDRYLDCDIIGINAKSIHYIWNHNRNYLFDFLTKAKNKEKKILWFDTYDSTASTEFEVLPYVDLYLKNQLLKNKNLYLNKNSRVRFYVNELNKIYKINNSYTEKYPIPNRDQLDKIKLSWNSCYENYNKNRYSVFYEAYQRYLRPNNFFPLIDKITFSPVKSTRENICSYRVSKDYKWIAIKRHREEISKLIQTISIGSNKIPLNAFFSEMEKSMISIGPFGYGEITLRDYEIILSGSTLIKPDISYIKTWPNLFKDNKTYVPIKWDLSNLLETIEYLKENSELRQNIAINAQETYKKYLIDNNRGRYFTDHFEKIIDCLHLS